MNLLDLADQVRLMQALLEKTIGDTEMTVAVEDQKPAVDLLLAAREAHRLTGDLARIAEDMVINTLGGQSGTYQVGDHSLQVRRSYKRSDWEHSKLAMHVALRATGGELIDQMPEVIDALLKACNPSWRVTVLKEMGLNDEDYATKELQRATVSVVS